MKPIYLITAGLMLLIACKKEEHEVYTNPDNPTNYVLSKITASYSGVPASGETFTYTYNSDYQLVRIADSEWYTGSPADTGAYTFEYADHRCIRSMRKSYFNQFDVYTDYAYNSGGHLSSYNQTFNGQYLGVGSFNYDPDGNLDISTFSSASSLIKRNYSYDKDKNLTGIAEYSEDNINPQQDTKTLWGNYDGKVNFMKTINGLPANFTMYYMYFSYNLLSPGNPRTHSMYPQVAHGNPYTDSMAVVYSYEYNDAGLPIKAICDQYQLSFDYKLFR
jgi:hypothetical protein